MRRLCWFAFPFSGAVFLAVYLLPEPVWLTAGGICALLALPGLLMQGSRQLRWMLAAFGLAAGLCWSGLYGVLFYGAAHALSGKEEIVSAVVTDWPRQTSYGCSAVVRIEPAGGLPVNALFYFNASEGVPLPDLRPGDRLSVHGRFRLADTVAGEESDYYYSRNIQLTAYAVGRVTVERPERIPLRCWPAYASQALKQSVSHVFSSEAAPLVTALITGDKSLLPGGVYSALRRTGMAHAVAVSGLHISFLLSVLTFLLGRYRKRTAVLGIGLAFFFAAVTGNTPSVLRAAFMHSMLLLAPLVDREEDRPTSLSAILMLLLFQNPYAAASVSLQLSFAAVAGISLFSGPLYQRWSRYIPKARLPGRVARLVSGTLAVSIGAAVFTTPLTAYYFHTVSLVAPLTNILTFWAVSLSFTLGICLALLGMLLPGAASLAAWPASLGISWVEWVTRSLARLPFAAVGLNSVYLRLWLLLVYLLLALWFLRRGETGRLWFPVGAGALCLWAALAFQAAGYAGAELTVSVLDVGQGLCVAFYADGESVLVDCGGTGNLDPGDQAADYLQGLGITRLDRMILTHYHADHAGGVPQLLERLEVGELVLPDVTPEEPLRHEIEALAVLHGVELRWVTEDTELPLGGARLRIYAPLGAGSANEEGLSILCSSGTFDALVTGDMDMRTERLLVKYGDLPDIELLVAGHHGSKYASSEELLLAAAPEYAAISVGYNSYGHPAGETLERLGAAGCSIYRTDWMGTITFQVHGAD